MLIKLQEVVIKVFIIFTMVILLFGCGSQEPQPALLTEDIMLNMRDGLENPTILEIYAQDIYDVEAITNSKIIHINYVEFDLNSDGIMDKIVIIESSLHSGTRGNSLKFLIGNESGTYQEISGPVIHLYSAYILENKTNGFHDILVVCYTDVDAIRAEYGENVSIILPFGYEGYVLLRYDAERLQYQPYNPSQRVIL